MDVLCSQLSYIHPNPNEPMTERVFVLLLIQLYRESPELWNVKSKNYSNKARRTMAIENILSVLRKYRPDYDEHKLKKKINILRTNFNTECQKLRQRKLLDGSSNEIAEPNLWYYNDFIFIKDQTATDTATSEESFIEQSTSSPPELETPSSPSIAASLQSVKVTLSSNKKIKRSPSTSFEELVDSPGPSHFQRPEYEAELVAKGWAIKLSRLSPGQRLFAEKIINDTLFEAEMGTLTRNGVTFLTTPDPLNTHCSE